MGLLLHGLRTDSSNWGNVGLGLCRGNANGVHWRHPATRAEERKEKETTAAISPAGNGDKVGNAAFVLALPQCSSCLPRCVARVSQHQALAELLGITDSPSKQCCFHFTNSSCTRSHHTEKY